MMLTRVLQLAAGLAIIAGLLAVVSLCFYAVCYLGLMLASLLPAVGKRHRHARWNELNEIPPRDAPARRDGP